ncbi:MAG: 50S ribosomal protein L6 [Anaerolineae bacterium]|nr:50S ribosomal protein L6 [Anaerolineae bacterium]
MSRIGRMPVPVPPGVTIEIKGSRVEVRGPKGELTQTFDPSMRIEKEGDALLVHRPTDEQRHRALHGLTRALLSNMVAGVSQGFQKQLEVNGVGYRADLQPDGSLMMSLGYSHPVHIVPPAGITFEVDARTRVITVKGPDKQQVGQMAAIIRSKRPIEPYNGKGIRYIDERTRRKSGKAGKTK